MSQIYDLFGYPADVKTQAVEASRKARRCPFTDSVCDGGGNRSQTKITLKDGEPLRAYFDPAISEVIPGICSVTATGATWVVCPRRLLAFRHDDINLPVVNESLQNYERDLLIGIGLPSGIEHGVWSEVYLKLKDDESDTNYHFDYILAPLVTQSLSDFARAHATDDERLSEMIIAARTGGYFGKREKSPEDIELLLPDLTAPLILEVMTASTSGSDTQNNTDIRGAFRNALLSGKHDAPGINKRQVWGRMVTQLFAKTALAQAWGGQSVWIVQDELLENIENTTRLNTSTIRDDESNAIRLAVMHYFTPATDGGERAMAFRNLLRGDAGLDFGGANTFTDILLPGRVPDKVELLKAVLRRRLAARVRL